MPYGLSDEEFEKRKRWQDNLRKSSRESAKRLASKPRKPINRGAPPKRKSRPRSYNPDSKSNRARRAAKLPAGESRSCPVVGCHGKISGLRSQSDHIVSCNDSPEMAGVEENVIATCGQHNYWDRVNGEKTPALRRIRYLYDDLGERMTEGLPVWAWAAKILERRIDIEIAKILSGDLWSAHQIQKHFGSYQGLAKCIILYARARVLHEQGERNDQEEIAIR